MRTETSREERAKELIDHVKSGMLVGSPDSPLISVLDVLLATASDQYGIEVLTDYLAFTTTTEMGNLLSTHNLWKEYSHQRNLNAKIPSPQTLMKHMHKFPASGRTVSGFDDVAMWRTFDSLLRIIFQVAQDCFGWGDGDYVITLDVTPMPSYSQPVWVEKENKRVQVAARSQSGLLATPQFRRKGKSTVPLFNGTNIGHNFIVMAAHHKDTKVAIPLAIRALYANGPSLITTIREFLHLLDSYPAPTIILADREFCQKDLTDMILEYVRRRPGVHFMIPMKDLKNDHHAAPNRRPIGGKSQRRVMPRKLMHQEFPNRKPLPKAPETWYATAPWRWKLPKKNRVDTTEFHLIFFYNLPDPHRDPTTLDISLRDFGQQTDMVGTMFLTNQAPDIIHAGWLDNQYRGRWAIENLFKRHKEHGCRIPSQDPLMRFMGFGLSMLAFGCHALWRLNRARNRAIRMDDVSTSYYLWAESVRLAIYDRLVARSK